MHNININGKGGVLASPDTNVPGGGSYYFHWERDGALSMRALMVTANGANISEPMMSYVSWVLKVQAEPDPNGIDVRSEPKYNLPNGDVFTGGWCRPQTDGPALRSTTLILYAKSLLASGQEDYVKQYLWTSNSNYKGGAIKYDLDWIAANWKQDSCDLWEEIRSNDFFWNRLNMKRTLLLGASFASSMGDSNTAATYNAAAMAVNATLMAHWNGAYLFESQNRQKDASVIVALNDGYADDGLFSPTSEYVAGTIKALNTLFCATFSINGIDTKANIPGVLYGRYEGDGYGGGNPWVLTTAALAEQFYRGASETLNQLPSQVALLIWQDILNLSPTEMSSAVIMAKKMAAAGDSVLYRVAYHATPAGFHLSEQLDKNTGTEKSATDLTWSYATVLKAMYYRDQFYKKLKHKV